MDGAQPHLGLALGWIWLWVWVRTPLQKKHGKAEGQSRGRKLRPGLSANKSTSGSFLLPWVLTQSWAHGHLTEIRNSNKKLPIPPNLSHFLITVMLQHCRCWTCSEPPILQNSAVCSTPLVGLPLDRPQCYFNPWWAHHPPKTERNADWKDRECFCLGADTQG